jgi:broad-specificity NMP kinase
VKSLSALLLVAAGFVATSAQADCAFPKAPATIPDGKTATAEQMQAAAAEFKAYNDAVEAYGACLEEETKSKSSGMADGQVRQLKSIQIKKYNSAVDELKAKVAQFNEQVRVFKARG